MGNLEDKKKSNVPAKTDLAVMKSMYYWLNAKPDTSIRVFDNYKKVNIDDIAHLNQLVQQKLQTHELFTNITSIDIIFDKGKILSFSAWDAFIQSNWDFPEKTSSISIQWDINIKLHNYELPQRHTMKVRLGSALNPGEIFQMMTSIDDDVELMERNAFIVAKVDFVNTVISNELLSIIENWHECLPKVEEKGWFYKFVEKHNSSIARTMHYCMPTTALAVLFILFKYFHPNKDELSFNNNLLGDIYLWLLLIIVVYFVGNFMGTIFGNKIYKAINRIKQPIPFSISKGDQNAIKEIRDKNSSLATQIKVQLILTLIGTIASMILTQIIGRN